jgi:hypothetical protein
MKARAFLEAEKPGQRRVARTCALLEVSKAAYYQSLKAEPSTQARTDAELAKVIARVHQVSDGTYGSPQVQAELANQGIACGRRRVARLMRTAGLEGRCKRRWRTTTVPGADEDKALDPIKRHFGPSAEMDTAAARCPPAEPGVGAATPAGRPLGAGATGDRTTSRCPLRSPKSLSPSTNAPSAPRGYWVNSAASAAVFMRRVGVGGLCPCCDEPVTVDELLGN